MTADEVHEAYDHADDLLRELAQHYGDPDAIAAVGRRWLHELGARRLGLVSAAALRTVFAECLTEVPRSDAPAGSIEFTRPKEIA